MNTLLGFLLIISILFSPLKVSSYFRTRHSRKKKEPLVDPSPQKSILSTSAHAPKILCQRSYDTKKGDSFRISLVIGLGFEPRTHSLEGCCSIQLSYPTGHFSETLSSKKRRKGKRLYCKHQIGNRFFADAETPAHLATKDSLPNHL